ncbi:unnamed protein product [Phytophthora fragariaefolia]|uniref:Unnamed protein product n=1 Tax=Phytophthora fragariaefolia TaxID=1490495 RepID=A0A9W6XPJ2_9STRA|nr:unnamed protein product [Phytophthora fragariaefolia]
MYSSKAIRATAATTPHALRDACRSCCWYKFPLNCRATSSAEEEPLSEISVQPSPLVSGVGAPAASEYVLLASPRSRCGRVVLPQGVNASVAMRVAPLAEFQLSPPATSSEDLPRPRSRQSTETESSLPSTPACLAPRCCTFSCGGRFPSENGCSVITPKPRPGSSAKSSRDCFSLVHRGSQFGQRVFRDSAADGYPLTAALPSVASALMSFPGCTVVECGSENPPPDEWQLASWPDGLQFTSAQLNLHR